MRKRSRREEEEQQAGQTAYDAKPAETVATDGAKEGIVVERADTEDDADAIKVTDSLPEFDEDHTGDADSPKSKR